MIYQSVERKFAVPRNNENGTDYQQNLHGPEGAKTTEVHPVNGAPMVPR
jgi:hypothetical protein